MNELKYYKVTCSIKNFSNYVLSLELRYYLESKASEAFVILRRKESELLWEWSYAKLYRAHRMYKKLTYKLEKINQ